MNLTLYKPELSDLWFKQQLLSDEETMSYNHAWGGTISFPKTKWADWYERWIVKPGSKRFYRYIQNEHGQFIGELAYHLDEEQGIFLVDVLLLATFRGQGYGKAALMLLCSIAKEHGISILYDDIALDNPAVHLFLKQGFKEESRTSQSILLKKEL